MTTDPEETTIDPDEPSEPTPLFDTGLGTALQVEVDIKDAVVRAAVRGEWDAWSCDVLSDAILDVCEPPGQRHVVVDLSKVSFIDSAGIRALVRLRDQIGEQFLLGAVSRRVERILTLTGLHDAFRRDDSEGIGDELA